MFKATVLALMIYSLHTEKKKSVIGWNRYMLDRFEGCAYVLLSQLLGFGLMVFLPLVLYVRENILLNGWLNSCSVLKRFLIEALSLLLVEHYTLFTHSGCVFLCASIIYKEAL